MNPLHPVLLGRSDLRSAWPLVRMAAPGTTLQGWLAEGARQIAAGGPPRRGLFALACERGYFYGLAAFTRTSRPPAATALEVKVLSLAALLPAEAQLTAFCEGMQHMAQTMGCDLLRLKVRDLPAFITSDALQHRGFVRRDDALEYELRPFQPCRQGDDFMTLRTIRLELARTAEFPRGSAARGYEFHAPLTVDGHIDEAAFRAQRGACTVRRFWPGEADRHGSLHHTRNHAWVFSYAPGEEDDESFHRLDQHRFAIGEYVTIREPGEVAHTFRVVSVK